MAYFLFENLLNEDEGRIYAPVNFAINVPDNGLSPVRHQVFIWTTADMLIIGKLGTKFAEIVIKIRRFSLTKMHLKTSSLKWLGYDHDACVQNQYQKTGITCNVLLKLGQYFSSFMFYIDQGMSTRHIHMPAYVIRWKVCFVKLCNKNIIDMYKPSKQKVDA